MCSIFLYGGSILTLIDILYDMPSTAAEAREIELFHTQYSARNGRHENNPYLSLQSRGRLLVFLIVFSMKNVEDENNQQTASPVNPADVTKANSCTIIITDPPTGVELGIDCMHYETGPNFRGFCQVPEGLHFIYHSTGMGSRQGFFLDCRKGEIIILRWDKGNEEISLEHDLPEGALQALHLAICNGELDKQLGPYPYTQLHLWNNVSGLMTARVLERADCKPGTPLYPGDAEDLDKQRKERVNQTAVVPHFDGLARVARFVNIMGMDKLLKLSFETPSEKTSYCMEKSALLEKLIDEEYNGGWEDMLGEMQLSFLFFLLLYSYPALEHWKYLVHTISLSERYLLENPKFSCAFFRLFYEQLNFSPTDFFETELSKDNFLKPVLSNLLIATDIDYSHGGVDGEKNATMFEHRKRFVNFIRKKFSLFDSDVSAEFGGSVFDLMDEDYPVIVDTVDSTISGVGAEGYNTREYRHDDLINNSPISVDMFSVQQDTMAPETDDEKKVMSRHEIDIGFYSWRYPTLYGSMETGEDLEMTATRIVEDNQNVLEEIESALNKKEALPFDDTTKMVNEAYIFLRDEIAKRQH